MITPQKALEIATEAHKNQKRWDGSPYINHPIAVANSFPKKAEDLRIISFCHDTIEDTNITIEDLRKHGFSEMQLMAIDAITKRDNEKYIDYILRVKADYWATEVKKADLLHNMSDLRKGSMLDKYQMAYWILSLKQEINCGN